MAQKPDAKVTYLDNLEYYEENIFTLNVGDIILLDNCSQHYETFLNNLGLFISLSAIVDEFEVYPIIPGCSLFVEYGTGTFTVIKKILS